LIYDSPQSLPPSLLGGGGGGGAIAYIGHNFFPKEKQACKGATENAIVSCKRVGC